MAESGGGDLMEARHLADRWKLDGAGSGRGHAFHTARLQM